MGEKPVVKIQRVNIFFVSFCAASLAGGGDALKGSDRDGVTGRMRMQEVGGLCPDSDA